jgi:hypothetical protein
MLVVTERFSSGYPRPLNIDMSATARGKMS